MLNIAELSRLNILDAIAYIEGLQLTKEQIIIAEPIFEGDQQSAAVPDRRGAGVSVAGPQDGDSVGR
jgi:hypothetical protein